ncbi:MAG TPA: RNA polymerase sigma factor [Chryseosolibacter sp.]|nr:RNA polymerase sigma factor [Chryseosolibacter sp.]
MDALRIADYATCKLEDYAIVRRVLAGEKELFEILMRRYNQTLYRVIRGYLKDEDEVQDAMQNAYLKGFDKLYQFRGDATFSTWLIRIGINEALLRLKDLKRKHVLSLNEMTVRLEAVKISDMQINPEKKIIRQESQQILERAIDSLPEKYRVIYMLKEIECMDNGQISEALGLTDSNIKVRLHRAKALLKESLYKLSAGAEVFEFGNSRCDAIVNFVMKAI